jgi:hypothetical protein
MTMKFFFQLFILIFYVNSANAQFTSMYLQAFAVDTLTNTETGTYEFARKFDNASDITFVLVNTEVSGAATNVVTVEQAACNTCSDWVLTDTVATITATGNQAYSMTSIPVLTGQNHLWGYRVRLKSSNSGTGVHRLRIYAIARRREGF